MENTGRIWIIYQTFCPVTEWSLDIYGPLDHSFTGIFAAFQVTNQLLDKKSGNWMVRLVTWPFGYQAFSLLTKGHSVNGPFGYQTCYDHMCLLFDSILQI